SAPASSAPILSPGLVRPDSTMIGARDQSRNATITSVPSTSGRPRSRIIASGGLAAATASASLPVPAVSTSYCLARRLIRSARSSCGWSSTTRTSGTIVSRFPSSRLGRQLIEGDVQREHVHAGLAEEADRPALNVAVDQRPDLRRGQVPCRGDPVDLQVRI